MYMKVKISGLNSVMTLLLVNVKHVLHSVLLDLFIRSVFMTIPHALVSTVYSLILGYFWCLYCNSRAYFSLRKHVISPIRFRSWNLPHRKTMLCQLSKRISPLTQLAVDVDKPVMVHITFGTGAFKPRVTELPEL